MIRLYPTFLLLALSCLLQYSGFATESQPRVTRNKYDNTITTVSFSNNGPLVDHIDAALKQYLELGSEHSLTLKFSNTDKNGAVIKRYQLFVNGIKAEHGSVAVVIKNSRIAFINSNVYKGANASSASPVLTEQQALNKALALINANEYMWEHPGSTELVKNDKSFQYPTGDMVWVEDYNNDILNKRLRLAYRFDIAAKKPLSRDVVYVDAQNGTILLKNAKLKHVRGTGTSLYSGVVDFEVATINAALYELFDSTRAIATYDMQSGTSTANITEIQSGSTTFPKSAAIDAHWGATVVFDYWKNEHNRTSYDDMGAPVVSLVNYDLNYNNAGWTGSYMIYGNGTGMFASGFEPLTSLDVCAHELGHAICEYTSDLVYARESGAMNEGFSDIWGAVIEKYATDDKDTWTMGEELRTGALRSMSNPNLFNDPDTRDGLNWKPVVGCNPTSSNDRCGVHSNSGVLNHWFYLLTEGGKGTNDLSNAFEVAGLGMKKAAEIAYATEQLLSSNATFDECRQASIGYAQGAYGNCSREVEALTRAWYAVGVGADFIPCAPQVGFSEKDVTINISKGSAICPDQTLVSLPPLRLIGGVPTGGNATVTINGVGDLKYGVDYTIPSNPITINSSSPIVHNVLMLINDNGDVAKDKELKLYVTVAANGTDLTTSYTYDTCVVILKNNNEVPDTNGYRVCQVNSATVKSKGVTPFFSRSSRARMQFVLSADDLKASGLVAGSPITSLALNVTEKNSTNPFTDFTVKIDPVNVSDLSNGTVNVSTQYYNGTYTTQLGMNDIAFSTPLLWNGSDNLAVEMCYTNNTTNQNNDYIEAFVGTSVSTALKYSSAGSGCALAYSGSGYYFSISKPAVRLLQPTAIVEVETTVSGSKQWDVNTNQTVYFTDTTSGKLMAHVAKADSAIGCTDVAITKQGNGMVPMSSTFAGVNRSQKEFRLDASKAQATASYEIGLYFDTSELAGVNLANVKILATTATHDTLIDTTNTILINPVHVLTQSRHSFTGTIRKGVYTQYYLLDNTIVIPNPPTQSVASLTKNQRIYVVNNPFTDRILIHCNLQGDAKTQIRLFDITGKQVYVTETELRSQQHSYEINLSDRLLPQGNYILQVITGSDVMTQKMVKM